MAGFSDCTIGVTEKNSLRIGRLTGTLAAFSTSILFLFFLPLVSARAGGDPFRCSQTLTQQDSSAPNLSSSSDQLQISFIGILLFSSN